MKNKVLLVTDYLGKGGTENIIKSLLERSNKNFCFYLYVLRKINKELVIKNKHITKNNSRFKFETFSLIKLTNLIRRNNFKIIHFHGDKSILYSFILKNILKNNKLIVHEHGTILKDNILYELVIRIFGNKIDLFIAVSEATKKALIEKAKIPEDKIVVLYNFVDLERFNRKNVKIDIKKEKEKLGIKKDEFIIGFVGRLAKVKGCEYLIKALPYLDFKYKVLIAGEGQERKNLEKLAKKLKVIDKIIFLGYVNKPELVYPLMNVLVVPSLSESFGLSVIEAQAMGVPVVASDVLGLKEIIGKSGILFKTKNYKDLSKNLTILKNKKIRDKMINKGLSNSSKYSFKDYIKKLESIYDK